MFVSVYLTCNTGIAGANLQKLSEIVCYECWDPFRHCGGLECVAFRVVGIKLACPNQRRDPAPV